MIHGIRNLSFRHVCPNISVTVRTRLIGLEWEKLYWNCWLFEFLSKEVQEQQIQMKSRALLCISPHTWYSSYNWQKSSNFKMIFAIPYPIMYIYNLGQNIYDNFVYTLITRKREPARSFFLENLAPNILLLRPTRLCVERKKLSYMFIQLLHVYKAVMVYFLRMLYFIFGDTFTSTKGILCQKTVH